MKVAEKAALYRDLAKLITADFHVDRSVALLLGQNPRPGRRHFLEALQRGLAAGKSITASLSEANCGSISGLEIALIDAGERSGTLAAGLSHLANYFTAADSAARKARGALIYPLVLVHLAIILPELPAAVMPNGPNPFGKILGAVLVLWIVLLGGAWLWQLLSHRAQTSSAADRAQRGLPLIGAARRHWALARFTQVFHAGLLAALRMSETLRLAGNAAQSGLLAAASEEAARIVERGELLSLALKETHAFPDEFVRSMAMAEEVGSLDEEMARWAGAETALAAESVDRASIWLPKIGYGVVVIFVIYRIFGMVQGYYGGMMQQLEKV